MTLTPATRVMLNQLLRECKHLCNFNVYRTRDSPFRRSNPFSHDRSKSAAASTRPKSLCKSVSPAFCGADSSVAATAGYAAPQRRLPRSGSTTPESLAMAHFSPGEGQIAVLTLSCSFCLRSIGQLLRAGKLIKRRYAWLGRRRLAPHRELFQIHRDQLDSQIRQFQDRKRFLRESLASPHNP